jgi:hypothetical protein
MAHKKSWELVEAVARSPLLQGAVVERGTDLADVERALLQADDLEAIERERLLAATRELAAFAAQHPR